MEADFPDTRWSLIRRLAASDGAGILLVDAYADAVARYLHARCAAHGIDRANDIVQEVMVHLLERPDVLARATPGPGSRFRHFLMSVAWNEARNALRRTRPTTAEAIRESDATDDAAIDRGMERAWAASVLEQAWQELRARRDAGDVDAEVVRISEQHLIAGTTLRDIAGSGVASLATCSRRLAQGRTLLQQAIVERLRHAGELGSDETPAQACDRLLAALA
jgi:RNA polymerase sigma factor (sigma-70 family)